MDRSTRMTRNIVVVNSADMTIAAALATIAGPKKSDEQR
jgi:hypothetical protein